ncbi:MAG: glycosyltransferase family 2 protein [Candidatus Accumulibacter sp.]|jgi:rhamnosyltransferase|nr:glycosyltransferase family 2 protein [Accumulibacter sp.]
MTSVVAVVVTYRPDLQRLRALLDATVSQVAHIIIVDNGNDPRFFPHKPCLHFLSLGDNLGIARAQNEGIRLAKTLDATHVLLLDQDSIPATDMVGELLKALEDRTDAACVGPCCLDDQKKHSSFIRTKGLRRIHCTCTCPNTVMKADYLISSGCLIPMDMLMAIGEMREDFFIDYVDIEWGLRAKDKGYRNYGVCSAHMQHRLGDTPILFFGKKIIYHNSLRHFYHFRNAFLLYKKPWVPLSWKVVDGYYLLLKFVFYSFFAKPRFEHFKMMVFGLLDGMRGKSGKYRGVPH